MIDLRPLLKKLSPPGYTQLELFSVSRVEGQTWASPGQAFCVSHCQQETFVLRYPLQSQLRMGLDVEEQRELRANASHLFLSDSELAVGDKLPLIYLWSIKEALYKAHAAAHNSDLYDFELDNPKAIFGCAKLRHSDHVFGYALIVENSRIYSLAWRDM